MLKRRPAAGGSISQPIFVAAMPAAGVTLLFEILMRGRGVTVLGSRRRGALARLAQSLRPARAGAGLLGAEHATSAAGQALHELLSAAESEHRLIIPALEHGLSMAYLHAVFPDGKFIYLYRRPQTHLPLWAAARGEQHVSAGLCDAWRRTTRATMEQFATLAPHQAAVLNYDDLIADSATEAMWLRQWLLLHNRAPSGRRVRRSRHRLNTVLPELPPLPPLPPLPTPVLECAAAAERWQRRYHPTQGLLHASNLEGGYPGPHAWAHGRIAAAMRTTTSC